MKSMSKMIVPAMLAAVLVSTAAHAQTAPAPTRTPPSPETIQRLQDGRIAGAIAALKMTDAQMKLWAPVEAQIRASQAARLKAMQARIEQRKAGAVRPDLPDRLDRMSAGLAERAERSKAFAVVFKPFYASLTDAQKSVAGPVLAQLQGGGRGHHSRWAMHGRAGGSPQ